MRLAQVISDSIDLFSWSRYDGCMKGGGDSGFRNIKGYDVRMRSIRFAVLSPPALIAGF
jgi:hypothetical protein